MKSSLRLNYRFDSYAGDADTSVRLLAEKANSGAPFLKKISLKKITSENEVQLLNSKMISDS